MELREDEDGWTLSLQAGYVQLIQIDFRLGLFLSDSSAKAQLFVETPCRLKSPASEAILIPEKAATLAPILSLFNTKVSSATIRKSGELTVEFEEGRTLMVDPDPSFEAWQVGCSLGFLLVCAPGGRVSLFQETQGRIEGLAGRSGQ
jgi:hypothetical protein